MSVLFVVAVNFVFIVTAFCSDMNTENKKALDLLKRGELQLAKVKFEEILKENPNYLPAINSLTVIYEQDGELEKLQFLLRQKVALANNETERMKIEEKIKKVEESLKEEGNVSEELSKAEELIKSKQYQDALTIYGRYEHIKRKNIREEIIFGAARCYYGLKDYVSAEKSFLKLRGMTVKYKDRAELYLCEIEKAKSVWTKNPSERYRGVIGKLGKLIRGTKDVEIRTTSQDLIITCKIETGTKFMETRNFDFAIKEFNEAIKQYPDSDSSAYSQFLIGHCYNMASGRGEPEYTQWNQKKAVQEFGNVYKKYKNNYEISALALENMGCLLGCLGRKKEQKEVYEIIAKEFPKSGVGDNAYYYLGEICRSEGNMVQAMSYYEKVVREYPKSELKYMASQWLGTY